MSVMGIRTGSSEEFGGGDSGVILGDFNDFAVDVLAVPFKTGPEILLERNRRLRAHIHILFPKHEKILRKPGRSVDGGTGVAIQPLGAERS